MFSINFLSALLLHHRHLKTFLCRFFHHNRFFHGRSWFWFFLNTFFSARHPQVRSSRLSSKDLYVVVVCGCTFRKEINLLQATGCSFCEVGVIFFFIPALLDRSCLFVRFHKFWQQFFRFGLLVCNQKFFVCNFDGAVK
ncbi:unnamed protein product [Amoebophrya sp. A120]|nr:unnamed protein product [Amoebophrya sp. A120]|eukprot:GSA120T00013245001.1